MTQTPATPRKTAVVTPAQAAAQLLAVQAAESSFLGFVKLLFPKYQLQPFQLDLIDKLDRLERGTLTNDAGQPCYKLMINMPPRHGKSWLATVLFPLYYMARRPFRHTMSVSYNTELAKTFGREVKRLSSEPSILQAFPDFAILRDTSASDHWTTTDGGNYFAISMDGTTSGRPANLLVIDDPIKNRSDAESATVRNKVWSDYTSAVAIRKQPDDEGQPPIEVVCLTRWHPDDLCGRIMETDEWKNGEWVHISIPAIRQVPSSLKRPRHRLDPSDPLYIPKHLNKPIKYVDAPVDAALWPDRFPLSELLKRKARDPREFESLYQQRPFIKGGNLIKSNWWRYRATVPNLADNPYAGIVIGVDTAFKDKTQNDYSVFAIAGARHDGDIDILDIIRGKWDFPALTKMATTINLRWRGRGLRGFYVEDKASGQSLIQTLRAEAGVSVIPVKVREDKVARAHNVTPLIEGGRVFLPKDATWLDDFISETVAFPSGKNDDQVDAVTIALDAISKMHIGDSTILNQPFNSSLSLNSQMSQTFTSTPITMFKGWGE
jgi:predicted phage terminase large subunit-like protein